MDYADTNMEQSDHEGRYKCQQEVLKQWAFMIVKNDHKTDSKAGPMDINAAGLGTWQPTDWQPQQACQPQWTYEMNDIGGKGKGDYGKGKGKGYGPWGKGYKGKSKGFWKGGGKGKSGDCKGGKGDVKGKGK